jgi:hypothetical protein
MKQVRLSIEKWQHIPESADWAVKEIVNILTDL